MPRKLGQHIVHVDKAIDFMASTQAFLEYLNKQGNPTPLAHDIPPEYEDFFAQRLAWYRKLYRPDPLNGNQTVSEKENGAG
ncbi:MULTISPECIES: hypothetical protein [Mangrovibacter]|uniref:Uncharacterized protein n=1 Tax=Mangrovibacter plantisponsor TaxID=451513 RepID=A0A317QAF8_9ENTR|nr:MULTISPECIES: hypothetical protein [Mangrovibacter]KEA53498.1 hypothetical protein DT73_06715 [Mangrovibacter sp. MFB070]PWW12906.1 hypothetical protein DES37_101483 [Mangrovibacter plantisponsor]